MVKSKIWSNQTLKDTMQTEGSLDQSRKVTPLDPSESRVYTVQKMRAGANRLLIWNNYKS